MRLHTTSWLFATMQCVMTALFFYFCSPPPPNLPDLTVQAQTFIYYTFTFPSVNPIKARLVFSSCGQVAPGAPFWKPCSSFSNVLMQNFCEGLAKAWPHDLLLVSMETVVSVLRWLKSSFLQNLKQDTVKMTDVLLLNETQNAKRCYPSTSDWSSTEIMWIGHKVQY